MTAVLDAGALIAIEKRDRTIGAILRLLQRDAVPLLTSAGAVAQVWRSGGAGQANLARILKGVDTVALDENVAKEVGEILKASGFSDVIDGHIAYLVSSQGCVLTSDTRDIKALLLARGVKAAVISV